MALKLCAAAVALFTSTAFADCNSYGIDYQSGGEYFQNINLNETFTALQQFSGCSNDTAHNVLVDPNGDQSECSQTPLLPDNTPQQVSCPQWQNPEMPSGDWSLLIVSNNGDGIPIAYQRDFYLDVSAPNVTVTAQATTTNTISSTSTITISTTVTHIAKAIPTLQEDGKAIGGTTTGADGTVTATSYYYETSKTTITETGSCTPTRSKRAVDTTCTGEAGKTSSTTLVASIKPSIAPGPVSIKSTSVAPKSSIASTKASSHSTVAVATPQVKNAEAATTSTKTSHLINFTVHLHPSIGIHPDPIISVIPTVLGDLNEVAASIVHGLSPLATAVPLYAKFKKDIIAGRTPSEEVKRAFVEERAARRQKRGPDSNTETVYGSSTVTINRTAYLTETRQQVITATVTPEVKEEEVHTTFTGSLVTVTKYRAYTIYQTTTSTKGVYTCY